ncbi:MAG: pyrroline-5-carboxylate reductase [bacterium]
MKIVFLGAGKMAEAIFSRLTSGNTIIVSDIDKKRLATLKRKYKITVASDNAAAFSAGEVVVLAVKPQQMGEVLGNVKCQMTNDKLRKVIISIAAGVPTKYLQDKLPGCQIVRAMPNNPALVGAGITAIAKGSRITHYALRITKKIFASVGEVVEIPEKMMDGATGLSGSGPAYVYQMIEAMTAGGVKVGLPAKIAAKLAVQTVFGAAAAVKETGIEPKELRAMVTSPGGTTIEGLNVLERREFSRAVIEAIESAAAKAKILTEKWGKS